MQTEGASGVEVLLVFGPPLGPSPVQRFGIASAASGFSFYLPELFGLVSDSSHVNAC